MCGFQYSSFFFRRNPPSLFSSRVTCSKIKSEKVKKNRRLFRRLLSHHRSFKIWIELRAIFARDLMHSRTLNALGKKGIGEVSRTVVENNAWRRISSGQSKRWSHKLRPVIVEIQAKKRTRRDLSWPRFATVFVSRRESLGYLMRVSFYPSLPPCNVISVSLTGTKYNGMT